MNHSFNNFNQSDVDFGRHARTVQKQLQEAYHTAGQNLKNRIVGERVRLTYPFQEGETEGPRVANVEGVVESVRVRNLPFQNVDFATYVTFEDGREFVDSESIEILS